MEKAGNMNMTQTGAKLTLNPDIIGRLEKGGLWSAAHNDGSDNRVNAQAIADAATVSASLGILAAAFQGIRKAFRNRKKTKADLMAEKEAVRINEACGSLDLLLRDYLAAAQKGMIAEDDLDTLTDTFKQMEAYDRAGTLLVPGRRELEEIGRSVAEYTSLLTGNPAAVQGAKNGFCFIREQLSLQKERISH